MDPLALNIAGVRQLVGSSLNKTKTNPDNEVEGPVSDYEDILSLDLSDEELMLLSKKWEESYRAYEAALKVRQERNKAYYLGTQFAGGPELNAKPAASNLIFEAVETFIPVAMAKNPEPVVWSDNTEEGKALSNDIKTMLQYHADVLVLRGKLSRMVRDWSIYFIGAIKHGWDTAVDDIKSEVVFPQNLILDPKASIDISGNYEGRYLGERKKCTAEELIEMFPKYKAFIIATVDGLLGTSVQYTEWWTNEYCFYTYKEVILDKNKNPNFNYDQEIIETDEYGVETPKNEIGKNHFAIPKMPYTFLTVFQTGDQPHDITNLIEQNIANQDVVNKRIAQIDKNLDVSNNSIAFSGDSFTSETAKQGAKAMEKGNPVLVPTGNASTAITRFPAPGIPNAAFSQLDDMTQRLRSVFGTLGLSAEGGLEEKTVRGQIMNRNQDSSRIGGGIGDRLEQVADTIFNWWVQLYYVYYDVPHEARILGRGRAVEYTMLQASDIDRKVVISVSPNSMRPKDEISEMNLAMDRWNNKSIDPIDLMKKLNEPDPMEAAKKLVMWTTNPMQYAMTYFPETQPVMPPMVGTGEEQNIPPSVEGSLSAPPTPAGLSEVPIDQGSSMPV